MPTMGIRNHNQAAFEFKINDSSFSSSRFNRFSTKLKKQEPK